MRATPGGRRLPPAVSLLTMMLVLGACGSPPPDAGPLLQRTSQRMVNLKGFHFQMQIGGYTGDALPVQSADGDAQPPNVLARVQLHEGGVLVEVEIIFSAAEVYLKSFTGGWQRLTPEEVAQFFDPHSLFDRQDGLFAAIRDTQSGNRGAQENVDSHPTWVITGRLDAARVHRLLSMILDQGSYAATYWIESPGDTLWRARINGNLFVANHEATITFNFSRHDQTVTVTPPPLG